MRSLERLSNPQAQEACVGAGRGARLLEASRLPQLSALVLPPEMPLHFFRPGRLTPRAPARSATLLSEPSSTARLHPAKGHGRQPPGHGPAPRPCSRHHLVPRQVPARSAGNGRLGFQPCATLALCIAVSHPRSITRLACTAGGHRGVELEGACGGHNVQPLLRAGSALSEPSECLNSLLAD